MNLTRTQPALRFFGACCLAILAGRGATLAAGAEWRVFHSEEGQFRVSMPGAPAVKTVPLGTDAGTLTQQQYICVTPDQVCAVAFIEVPPQVFEGKGVDQAVEDACDGAVREMGVRETQARRSVSLQGHTGRTIEAVARDGSLEFLGRVYVVGTRLFILFYGQSAGKDRADAERFFLSFTLE